MANLIAIVGYIEKDNAERAKLFALEIQTKPNSLAELPGMGRLGRVIGTRELVIHPNHIILYRVRSDVVEILRAQHAGRRSPRHL
ncbi:toxin ParE1/3/4 [Oxalobacteraceae bacterium GrIS 1.18]